MLLFPFHKSSVKNVKVLATFYKKFALYVLKTKTISVNPDEHEY